VKKLVISLEGEFDHEFGEEEFIFQASEKLLEKFLKGEDLELVEEEINDIISKTTVDTVISSIKRKGLLNTIDDENGEEILFLTDLGKKVREMLKEEHEKFQNFNKEKL